MSETKRTVDANFDKLEIMLTEDERRDEWGDLGSTVGFSFMRRVDGTGNITISEKWVDHDEVWAPGVSVHLPQAAFAELIVWATQS